VRSLNLAAIGLGLVLTGLLLGYAFVENFGTRVHLRRRVQQPAVSQNLAAALPRPRQLGCFSFRADCAGEVAAAATLIENFVLSRVWGPVSPHLDFKCFAMNSP
jgi:hypothetical protein